MVETSSKRGIERRNRAAEVAGAKEKLLARLETRGCK
jgi:hypothetical protein